MTANPYRWAKATLTQDEIARVRVMVERNNVKGVAEQLGLNPGTIFRILSGLPVHNLTASHLRTRLPSIDL